MKSASYINPDGIAPTTLAVLKTHPAGTVDLGTEAGVVLIGNCTVSETPKPGQCSLNTEESAQPAAKVAKK